MKSRIRIILSVFLVLGFGTHCFLPYLGLRFEGCHTMFSNFRVSPDLKRNNHFFIKQLNMASVGYYSYLQNSSITWSSEPNNIEIELEKFLKASPWINNQALSWALARLCTASHQIQADFVKYPHKISFSGNLCDLKEFQKPNKRIPIQLFPPNDRYELAILAEGFL